MKKIMLIFGGVFVVCVVVTIIVMALSPSEEDQANQMQDSVAEVVNTEMPVDEPVVEADTDIPVNELVETELATETAIHTEKPIPTATPEPTATPDTNLINAGTYIVNTDIQPGLYKGFAGEGIFDSCYWARLKNLTGDFGAILANDNAIGQYYVEVKANDYAFETACELRWLNSSPEHIGEYPTTLAPGTYLVGSDIQPGTYKGQAGSDIMDSCYWARVTDVSGDMGSVIANDNAMGQYYVQVLSSDFALSTACELEWVGQ